MNGRKRGTKAITSTLLRICDQDLNEVSSETEEIKSIKYVLFLLELQGAD